MNLFNLDDFNKEQIMELIIEGLEFKTGKKENIDKLIALLFFEPSTRTHYSFEVAAKRLGIKTITFTPEDSSLQKGESFIDTIKTFNSFDIDGLVIRDEKEKYYEQLDEISIPIINGGDGKGSHPTQSLLDLMTIYEQFNKFEGLNIAIIGDIKHSRVARTNYEIMTKLGMNVTFIADEKLRDNYGKYEDFEKCKDYDIFMLLRVQLERHDLDYNIKEYNEKYGFNKERLIQIKNESIIMHPAPFNLNVELTDDVLKDKRCKIFEQSKNGVYMRMAVLKKCLKID